jgi:hypothetical protein
MREIREMRGQSFSLILLILLILLIALTPKDSTQISVSTPQMDALGLGHITHGGWQNHQTLIILLS